MSIQRYRSDGQGDCDPGGMYVLYTDHLAALADEQAQRGVVYRTGLALGRAEALQDAREAVIVATAGFGISVDDPVVVAILAAIDALKGEAHD